MCWMVELGVTRDYLRSTPATPRSKHLFPYKEFNPPPTFCLAAALPAVAGERQRGSFIRVSWFTAASPTGHITITTSATGRTMAGWWCAHPTGVHPTRSHQSPCTRSSDLRQASLLVSNRFPPRGRAHRPIDPPSCRPTGPPSCHPTGPASVHPCRLPVRR